MSTGQGAAPQSAAEESKVLETVETMSVKSVSRLDQVGVVLSTLCLVHCILTPLLLVALPVAGAVTGDEWFHRVMLVVLVPVAAYAFIAGARQHKNRGVLALGLGGMALITLGAFQTEGTGISAETVLTVLGSLCLVAAHWINRRLCHNVCQPARQVTNCCYHEAQGE